MFLGGREGYFEDALADAEFAEAVVADGVHLMTSTQVKRRGRRVAKVGDHGAIRVCAAQEGTSYLLGRILYSGEQRTWCAAACAL